MDKNKLIHDLNSQINSLKQGIKLLEENVKQNPEMTEKILNLVNESIGKLESTAHEVKEVLK